MEQTLGIGECELTIISMRRNWIYLFLGKKPRTMKDEEWNLLDRQVLGVIWLTLSKLVAHIAMKKKTNSGIKAWLI